MENGPCIHVIKIKEIYIVAKFVKVYLDAVILTNMKLCISLVIISVGETGKVVGIDHIDELINWSKENVWKDNPALFDLGRIKFVVGDERK